MLPKHLDCHENNTIRLSNKESFYGIFKLSILHYKLGKYDDK